MNEISGLLQFMQEPSTYSMQVVDEMTRNHPKITLQKLHATGSGMRAIVTFTGDPNHRYEVIVNPLYEGGTCGTQ